MVPSTPHALSPLCARSATHHLAPLAVAQVYSRKVAAGPPMAIGVSHYPTCAEEVASFLFQPDQMHVWNDDLCEKGEARGWRHVLPGGLQQLSSQRVIP